MSDRFNLQSNNNNEDSAPRPENVAPAPANGHPHPATTPPESQNAPQCPVIQNFATPTSLIDNNPALNRATAPLQSAIDNSQSAIRNSPIPSDIPDYTPAEPHDDDPPLSPTQLQAIYLLLQGLSDTAVAKRLCLNRKTIYRWKWHTPIFYNTLDEAQRQAWNEAYGLLRSSILNSAKKLNQIIKKGNPQDAIRAAKVLLSTPVLTRLEG